METSLKLNDTYTVKVTRTLHTYSGGIANTMWGRVQLIDNLKKIIFKDYVINSIHSIHSCMEELCAIPEVPLLLPKQQVGLSSDLHPEGYVQSMALYDASFLHDELLELVAYSDVYERQAREYGRAQFNLAHESRLDFYNEQVTRGIWAVPSPGQSVVLKYVYPVTGLHELVIGFGGEEGEGFWVTIHATPAEGDTRSTAIQQLESRTRAFVAFDIHPTPQFFLDSSLYIEADSDVTRVREILKYMPHSFNPVQWGHIRDLLQAMEGLSRKTVAGVIADLEWLNYCEAK